ncbi:hypothetical protein H4R18_000373 [Coemansia javaensis]|uniref:Cation/H+ exchanger transmembrane domain-containing protein n=1 Tax=Coemansia javaensis TaxID=2761396 RepID=A0A9W8LLU3_9FUNG|nr:hypothetical protein H4R18_000373 [Coemansia javaensis]
MGIETKVVPAFLGGFICIYGLVSGFVKERLFLSEALVAMVFGIIVGPRVIGVVDPREFMDVEPFTREFARYVIAIQVMAAGITLPGRYMVRKWRTMSVLLGPVMVVMWLVTAGIVHLMFDISFKQALLIASCAAPTDPILANSVVKGRYAEANVPKNVRDALSAESGVNDGLGLPFLYFSLYLLNESYSTGHALGRWFYWTWCYNILLSIAIGIVVGYIARKLLRLAESYDLIDKESFLAFSIGLAVFLVGVLQLIGSDDVLCCFIAGHSFTWDDWFREETKDAHFQEVLDGLINVTFFIYFGTIIPWDQFNNAELVLAPWRLIVAAIMVLLLRRLPVVLLLTRLTPALRNFRQSLFAGWFGPIGVGAVFFAEVVLEEIEAEPEHYHLRARETIAPIVMFLIFASVLVHGTTLPLMYIGKVVRTRSRSMSTMSIRNGIASRLSFVYSRESPNAHDLHAQATEASLQTEYVSDTDARNDDGRKPAAPNGAARPPPSSSQDNTESPGRAENGDSLDLIRTITIDDTPKVARDEMDIHYNISQSRGQFRRHVQNLNLPITPQSSAMLRQRASLAPLQRSRSVRDVAGAMPQAPASALVAPETAATAVAPADAAETSDAAAAVGRPGPAHIRRRLSRASGARSDTDLPALRADLAQQRLPHVAIRESGSPSDAADAADAADAPEDGLVLAADGAIASRLASRAATRYTVCGTPEAGAGVAPEDGPPPVPHHVSLPVRSSAPPPAHHAVDIGPTHAAPPRTGAREHRHTGGIRRVVRRRRRRQPTPAEDGDGEPASCEFIGNRRNPLGRLQDGELVDYDDPDDDDLETAFTENNVDDRLVDYFTLDISDAIARLRTRLPALRRRPA